MGGQIRLRAGDGVEFSAYRADPAGSRRGAVVVIQEVFGVNVHIRDVCDRFAEQGYAAIAPALFDRVRPGVELGYDEAGVTEGRALVTELGWDAPAGDVWAAAKALRADGRRRWLGPDGKVLVAVIRKRLVSVSLSLHHAEDADWLAICADAKRACLAVAREYVAAGELEAPAKDLEWLFNGAGTFAVGGPMGDNGLSGKKLVAEAYGASVPIGGGTVHGKDPLKPDVRAQRIAREIAVEKVREGSTEATVWVVFRPGDEEPRWIEERLEPCTRLVY